MYWGEERHVFREGEIARHSLISPIIFSSSSIRFKWVIKGKKRVHTACGLLVNRKMEGERGKTTLHDIHPFLFRSNNDF
jgi:hypothetical protein